MAASKQESNPERGMKQAQNLMSAAACGLLSFLACASVPARAQSQPPASSKPATPESGQSQPARAAASPSGEEAAPIPGDWAPELLYGMWNSSNSQASEALYDAAFAAGPEVIPELQAALQDDRTAEFAAQSLAFIGGNRSIEILARLMDDPRDLGLKRFFYGALAEINTPEATRVLLEAIAKADSQPDRTITEVAILALTVRTDSGLLPKLHELESAAQDPVIRDDLENASDVIRARAKYMALPENQNPDFSLDRAVRTYFLPALESPAVAAQSATAQSGQQGKSHRSEPAAPAVSVRIDHLIFSPDRSRALAHVVFEIPTALAHYDMVLEKRAGNWRLASVWLGSEEEIPTTH
jgi:hypothetical protein